MLGAVLTRPECKLQNSQGHCPACPLQVHAARPKHRNWALPTYSQRHCHVCWLLGRRNRRGSVLYHRNPVFSPSAFPPEPAKLIVAWGIYAFCELTIAACSIPSQRPWPRNVLFNTHSTRREATSYCRTRGRLSCFYLERDSEEGLKSVVPRPTAAYLGCPSEGASRSEGQVGGFWLRSADV